jgi:crotonobetainyl-CoA:carnitine CoA-transferase CaiB-like acyl-CoA transferase
MGLTDALQGVTVLDLSQGIAGPYCAALLGELGARVLKVEPPGGDWLRQAGGRIGPSTAMFETFNRGKQSLVLDLKTPAGAGAARQLARQADVVVESARVGAMARLGLDHAALSAGRDDLVSCSISGFGQHGPGARRPATDTVIQAYTGLARHATALPGAPRLRLAVADVVTGLYAAQATQAALLRRWRTGRGHWVQVDLAHAMAALQAYKIADTLVNGDQGEQEAFAIAGNYEAADGALAISAASDAQVVAGLQALGLDALLQEPAFADARARQANQRELRLRVAQVLATQSVAQARSRLDAAGVPCQPILDYAGFVAASQHEAPGLFRWLETASGARLPAVPTPGNGATTVLVRAPSLNEHGAALRAEFHLEIA